MKSLSTTASHKIDIRTKRPMFSQTGFVQKLNNFEPLFHQIGHRYKRNTDFTIE